MNVFRWKSFRLPKRGSSASELEDAVACNAEAGRFAVADGATESIAADTWAELLVRRLSDAGLPDAVRWTEWLAPIRGIWWKAVRERTLPWFAEHKLSDGAAAAFVALQLSDDGRWSAAAVGDCVLFHLRHQELI